MDWIVEKISVIGPGIVGMPMAGMLAHARIKIGQDDPAKVAVGELEGLILEALQHLEAKEARDPIGEGTDEAVPSEEDRSAGQPGARGQRAPDSRMLGSKARPLEVRELGAILYWKR